MAWAYGGILGGISLAAYLAICVVLWYGGKLVIENTGHLDAPALYSFLLYTVYIAVALGGLSGLYSQLMAAVGASKRMFEIIDREPVIITDKLDLQDINALEMSLFDCSSISGRVKFNDVSFSYPCRPEVRVLKGLSCEFEPGTFNALVGESGGGKSTIINLLQRFYDPDCGNISIDGCDIRSMNTIRLHSILGVVSQMPIMFAMSIGDNIRYGVHRDVSDEEVYAACKEANASGFINKVMFYYEALIFLSNVEFASGLVSRKVRFCSWRTWRHFIWW